MPIVTISVKDSGGVKAPIVEAKITVREGGVVLKHQVTTDENGQYKTELPPGQRRYRVSATAFGKTTPEKYITVEDRPVDVLLELEVGVECHTHGRKDDQLPKVSEFSEGEVVLLRA